MSERGRVKIEQSTKQVRVMLGGEIVASTTRPLLVWEVPYFPTYYFPEEDVRTDLLVETGETRKSPSRGEASQYTVKVNGSEGAAYAFKDPKIDDIAGHYAFVWKSMDHWFEEDEEVWVHARDPYTRIDILPSSRRVRVELDGETVADTTNAFFLYETGLPTRYYMSKTDVRMDLLTPTETETACPYKGTARYWSVTVGGKIHQDLVWGYDSALAESQEITGMVCFYNEKVDVYIDEELEEKPKTKFG